MTNQPAIRAAEPRDAAAIAAVQVASWRTTYPGIVAQDYIDGLSVEARTTAWARRMSGDTNAVSQIFVAESKSGAIVGFSSGGSIREAEPGFDAELHAIYLLQDVQRRGVGRRLVTQWAEFAVACGLRAAVVRVLAANPACRFYERLGARWIKNTVLEIGGQPYAEVWYGWDELRSLSDQHDR